VGWTGSYTNESSESVVRAELEWGGHNRVVKNKGAKYWAVQNVKSGEVFAVVALTKRRKDGYQTEVLTKLISEQEGPGDLGYPLALLKILSPATEGYSAEWRAKVVQHHAAKSKMPTLKSGDRVIFETPIEFTNGGSYSELIYRNGFKFTTPMMNGVRLSRSWKTRYKWSIAPTDDSRVGSGV
jgi:hypothetical protein